MEPIVRTAPRIQDRCCMVIEPTDLNERQSQFQAWDINIQAGPSSRWGVHGNGIALYIDDPDDNVAKLRYDAARIPLAASRLPRREEADS